jgi:hypothetical protein
MTSTFFFKKIPQMLSVLLHPLLMPTLGIYIILNSGTYLSLLPAEGKNLILLVVASLTLAIPAAFMPFYYYRKITKSFQMIGNQERAVPLLITALLYYLSFYLLHRWGIPYLVQSFILASACAVFVTMLITTRWKISAHSVGIGGIIGLIISISILYQIDLMFYLMVTVLLAGSIGFARLSLNAHTPAQVYAGLAMGFGVTTITMMLF